MARAQIYWITQTKICTLSCFWGSLNSSTKYGEGLGITMCFESAIPAMHQRLLSMLISSFIVTWTVLAILHLTSQTSFHFAGYLISDFSCCQPQSCLQSPVSLNFELYPEPFQLLFLFLNYIYLFCLVVCFVVVLFCWFLFLHQGCKLRKRELISINYADNMPNELIFDSLGH